MKKTQKGLSRIVALALAVLICFTGCSAIDLYKDARAAFRYLTGDGPPIAGGRGHTNNSQRRTIPYGEMEYVHPDGDLLISQMEEIVLIAQNPPSYDAILEGFGVLGAVIEEVYTMYTLADLHTYQDVTDTYYPEEVNYCYSLIVDVFSLRTKFLRAALESEFGEQLRSDLGEETYQTVIDSFLMESDEIIPLSKERGELNNAYNNRLANLTVTVDGVTYTMEDIEDVYYSEGFDAYIALMKQYYSRENAQWFADTYLRMIELDKQTALTLGFASAADMYYLQYGRDYTPADTMSFAAYTKELFVDLAIDVEGSAPNFPSLNIEDAFSIMPSALAAIDSGLVDAWSFMLEYDLHDFEARANKFSGGAFCTTIDAYDAPFIYGYWDGTFSSGTTLMHEFGHFYDSWYHFDTGSSGCLDVLEIYSQGLELLMQEYFGLFTDNADRARQAHLADFMNPLAFQMMLEEFQLRVYQLDTFDVDVISRLYADISQEYGMYSVLVDENGCDYSWIRITHFFDAPFYTVSYWTSAIVALQIWAAAQDDYQAGVDLYFALITANQNLPLTRLVESAGLQSPGDPATLRAIAEAIAEAFGLNPSNYV